MDNKVFIVLLSLIHLASGENASLDVDKAETEHEISDAVKEYVAGIVSDMTVDYDSRIRDLEMTVSELQQKSDAQKNEIKELKLLNRVKNFIISKLERRVESLESKSDILIPGNGTKDVDLEKDNTYHQAANQNGIESTKQRPDKMKRGYKVRESRAEVDTRVAFFAYMVSHSSHLGKDQSIIFNHAVTNIGNAYNGHHGNFVAPMPGVYVFFVTLAHYQKNALSPNADASVLVNDRVVARLYMSEQQSSQTIVVNLRAGDDVSVHNRDVDDGITGELYSTFSGFLLYEDVAVGSIVG